MSESGPRKRTSAERIEMYVKGHRANSTRMLTSRKFPDPDLFDVMRDATDQLAFGCGPHKGVGQPLARLEMAAIFRALADRVKRFHIESELRDVNNVLRGFSKLIVSVE